MTYTFKLSRRLAVSRYATLATIAVLVGCDGETTAPESDLNAPTGAAPWIRVVPSTATIEIQQTIRFRGERRSARGEARPTQVWWKASGGMIDEHGNFAAASPGVYKVIGRGRGRQKPDTSVVVVVPKQPDLAGVSVSPDTVTLEAGAAHTFTATGTLSDGSTTAIGVTWKATGGSIDAGGVYTAGSTAGTYRVMAASTDGTLADTATVTIPEPPAPPPPAPTLARVVLKPASVSLATGTTKQFTAYGWDSAGDSVVVQATFSATGGTITSAGLYTAGQTAGTYRVIAAASGFADTSAVTLTTPSTTGELGIPFGPYALLNNTSSPAPLTMGVQGTSAGTIVSLLGTARSKNVKLLLGMTGGAHGNYMSTINGVYQFDMAKWKAAMDAYNTSTIRQAVAGAVTDGTIVGNWVMDEPQVHGVGVDGNTWGPAGTMTKARVDSMCAYVKAIFPTLPTGVVHQHAVFEPTKDYRTCEFIVDQYGTPLGSVTSFRDAGLAYAQRGGIQVLFGLNIVNGGTKDLDGTWDCKDQGGYKGGKEPLCQMTASQLKTYASVLGPAGCGLEMWKWRDDFMSRADNQAAFRAVADEFAQLPRKSCARS